KHKDYQHLTEQEFIKNTILDGNNRLAICQYSYDDLNNFLKCPSNIAIVCDVYNRLLQKKKDAIQRCWCPVVFYLYEPGRFGKTGLNGYEDQEIIFFNEFYTKIDWSDIINVLNDISCLVEIKYEIYKTSFKAKYIFMSSTKPLEEAYNFGQCNNENNNKRDYKQCLEANFQNIFEESIVKKDEQMYWYHHFPEYKKRYLCNYLNLRRLDKYCLEFEQLSITNQIEDPQIESSNQIKEP
ncbi:13666_t:CDS:2, partial [Dentiscutata heterogama]